MKPEEHLGELIKIKIDRPMGSKHPEYGFVYPVNYGYVPGTIGGDGEELDAYLLGVYEPVEKYEGRLIGIIYRENDVEEKLVISPKTYTAEQIMALTEFQERWFVSWVAHIYDKSYWPEAFNPEMKEVKDAIKIVKETGEYSLSTMQARLKKGRGFMESLGEWMVDNKIITKKDIK